MSITNNHFLKALRKIEIFSLDNFVDHDNFQSLPATRDDRHWDDFKASPFNLNSFELGALKNARCCDTPSQQQTRKYWFINDA